MLKTFKQYLEEKMRAENLVDPENIVQQRKASRAVSKTIQQDMAGDQAMKAIEKEDPRAEKKLVAKTLAKPQVTSIQQVAPVLGLKINRNPI